MKILKKILIVLGIILAVLVCAGLVYKLAFGQKKAQDETLGSADAETRMFVAAQGSDFKDSLLKKIKAELTGRDVYVKITDVSNLKDIDIKNWDFVLIMAAIEAGKIHNNAEDFILKNSSSPNMSIVLTSGGRKDLSDFYDISVDSVSSASEMEELDSVKNRIMDKINYLLK
jgi:hypothetical protein